MKKLFPSREELINYIIGNSIGGNIKVAMLHEDECIITQGERACNCNAIFELDLDSIMSPDIAMKKIEELKEQAGKPKPTECAYCRSQLPHHQRKEPFDVYACSARCSMALGDLLDGCSMDSVNEWWNKFPTLSLEEQKKECKQRMDTRIYIEGEDLKNLGWKCPQKKK